jgi:hypothetical protein
VWKFYSRKKAKGFRILHEECMCQWLGNPYISTKKDLE